MEGLNILKEKLAIDFINSIDSAVIGTKAYRNRGFFTRAFHFFTGKGNELESQIFADIITSQKAVIDIVTGIIKDHNITKKCIIDLTDCVREIILKLNENEDRFSSIENHLKINSEQIQILIENFSLIKSEIERIDNKIDKLIIRTNITKFLESGTYCDGFPQIIRCVIYLFHVIKLYWNDDTLPEHIEFAKAVISQLLNKTSENYIYILKRCFNDNNDNTLLVGYLTNDNTLPICNSLFRIAERKITNIECNFEIIKNDKVLIYNLYDIKSIYKYELTNEFDFAVELASELLNYQIEIN